MASSEKQLTSKDKWVIALLSGLLFLLVASPFLFSAMNGLTSSFGMTIADGSGCPNLGGLLLHSVVFILIVRIMMR